ncbi:NnrS family protein [Bosea thiooxidans]
MIQDSPERGQATHPLLSEALKLFFPVTAAHAVLLPLIWVTAFAFELPFARQIPASQWHAHEMIFGTYGAALAGFLGSAMPEWTDTKPRRGRALLLLLALWLPGRLIGFLGADALILPAALTDFAFLALLLAYIVRPLIERRSTRHGSFALWIMLFALIELGIRAAWLLGETEWSARLLQAALAVFLVFLSLAIARINVVVVNHALDPSGETTPYRPHPGRQNLTAGLVGLQLVAALIAPHSAVPAWLALAAAAAFFDRLAEWFIGRAVLRAEVLALAAANAYGGFGFLAIGLAGLGVPVAPATGLHLLSVGALGSAVMAVLVIAGLRHSGRDLVLPPAAKLALALMAAAGLARVLPEIGIGESLLGRHYQLAAGLWSAAFATWLIGFWPILNAPKQDDGGCG